MITIFKRSQSKLLKLAVRNTWPPLFVSYNVSTCDLLFEIQTVRDFVSLGGAEIGYPEGVQRTEEYAEGGRESPS